MKPTFALDLTRETIGLLHRTPKGWLSIGEVAFDAPDLPEAMDYLRKTALGLSPLGVATKLILPNSQILYTDVTAPGPSREDKRRQIATALEGRTPYAVEDLVFDWSGKGATVKVAVIARETLEQAEGFAVEHRLNPVSFVAIPEDGAFVGEPWFGPTAAATSILAEDETVDRDREPVSILHRELPKAEPAVAASVDKPEPAPAVVAAPADDDLPGLADALNSDLPEEVTTPIAAPANPPATPPSLDPVEDLIDEASALEPEATLSREAATEPVAAARDPEPAAPASAPAPIAPVAAQPVIEVEEAPFAHVTDTSAFPEGDGLPAAARKMAVDHIEDDIPPAPPSAAMVAFASRRGAAADSAVRPMDGVTRSVTAAGTAKPAPAARPSTGKAFSGLVTAPSIPGTRAKPKLKGSDIPRPAIGGPTTVKSPARPGGTFGTVAPAKKRTGTVFMVMVALLLLFLALVAAWASYFVGGNGAPTEETTATTQVVPGVDDEMLADMQDPEGMTDPIPEAEGVAAASVEELATESLPVNIGGEDTSADLAGVGPVDAAAEDLASAAAVQDPTTEPVAETEEQIAEVAAAPAPEPAPATVVATDVSAASAPVEDQDEIFLSAMDAPPPALDALALPALAVARDVLPDPVMPPPAPGTVYQFDANGLLKATPDGIMSPEGVFLIAGKPPLLPPARSDAATAAALAAAPVVAAPEASPDAAPAPTSPSDASLVTAGEADPAVELPPADPAMAGFRPRPRPEGLAPDAPDDAALTPVSATEFATLRPLPRPANVAAAAAAAASTQTPDLGAQAASLTAQAEAKLAEAAALEAQNPSIVAISMRPASRPNDFSGAVEAAVAAAVREPAPQPEVELAAAAPAVEAKPEELDELDEPEPARAAPSIPTKASVAKQATFANAINLSKINLIGTYGTDSRRYALVRQSNGKYKKVKVGDKIDGGTIKAITETEVRYQKGGRLISLKMPKA
ncbi:hypothetical protein [Tabrizicola sp.]|uniref:hypothetical protein n=1 Tax=Tabrizicola sp. TaxID=2005166 RepID=UPI002732D7B2|nr:hypothetical protein [Tabrizicola sp.]MDP3194771.1 hypothetical protein [Tabrizicola sp.]